LESAKKCVTTYLPNESVPKMDGAQVYHPYLTTVIFFSIYITVCRRAQGFFLQSVVKPKV